MNGKKYAILTILGLLALVFFLGLCEGPAVDKRASKREIKASEKVIQAEQQKREAMRADSIANAQRIEELENEAERLRAKIENIDTHPKYEKDYPNHDATDKEFADFLAKRYGKPVQKSNR